MKEIQPPARIWAVFHLLTCLTLTRMLVSARTKLRDGDREGWGEDEENKNRDRKLAPGGALPWNEDTAQPQQNLYLYTGHATPLCLPSWLLMFHVLGAGTPVPLQISMPSGPPCPGTLLFRNLCFWLRICEWSVTQQKAEVNSDKIILEILLWGSNSHLTDSKRKIVLKSLYF